MRIRSTKPEFWRSKTIARIDWSTRLVLKGIESYVDDNGVGKDDLALIAADVFPRDLSGSPRDTLARLSEAISVLSQHGLIVRYELDGEDLLYVDRWKKQQRIDKPAKGRFRRPDGTLEYGEDVNRDSYASPPETVASPPEVLAPGTGEQGNRGTGEQTLLSDESDDTTAPPDALDRFGEFWDAYAKKVDRRGAEQKWRIALKKPGVTPDRLIQAAREYVTYERQHNEGGRYVMDPARWLNGERWLDERKTPLRAVDPDDRMRGKPTNMDAHRALIEQLAQQEQDQRPVPRQIGEGA